MLVIYSDDFAIAGCSAPANESWEIMDTVFGFSKKEGKGRRCDVYLSIHRTELPPSDDGARRCQLNQTEYIEAICKAYMEERGLQSLKSITTPMPTREEGGTDEYLKYVKEIAGPQMAENAKQVLKDLGLAALPDELPPDKTLYDKPGEQAATAATHVQSMAWVGRGTRPDALACINRLSGRLQRWTAYEDKLLERAMRYLWHTRFLALEQTVHPGDWWVLSSLAFVDADHGGDMVDTKSTTGYGVFMAGPRSKALCSFGSKQQPATAKSTGDGETAAISECVCTSSEAHRILLEHILDRPVWAIVRSDADVAIAAILKGYSRKMSYLRRTQKVSLGYLHDYFGCENTLLDKVPGPKSDSDILTKGLDHISHWRHTAALGLRASLRHS
jgi:uncharacterized protein YqgV (UPF0045/DUF77 family)